MAASYEQAANAIRCLSFDIVNRANSGHPGAPMGMAPAVTVLFADIFKFDPVAPQWLDRDRFVLSNGHAAALQYTLLHVCGYNLSMDDLKQFRQINSLTPGHPERHITEGVEVTTGPLGQGVSNAVGLAIAEAHLAGTFNRTGYTLFDHRTYAFCGDGCLMEGVGMEALSLAGHLKLNKLTLIYDDNGISIDGSTSLAFTEDTEAKFKALGWNVVTVEKGDTDFGAIANALRAARACEDKPTLIKLRTTIGYLAKDQGTAKVHGQPLGLAEAERIKKAMGRPTAPFFVEPEVYATFAQAAARGKRAHREWSNLLSQYAVQFPGLAAQLESYTCFRVPEGLAAQLPLNGPKGLATRKASENALAAILPALPQIIGGSADLTHSNLTRPSSAKLTDFQANSRAGRVIRFGVREHGMAGIINGIDAHGGLIAFGATFMNFIGYALGAVRLSAMSNHGVIYVATHDSIGLGEDGPTHQPVELLQLLRAMPNLLAFRPADQTETSAAWLIAVESRKTPSVLCLSRHSVEPLANASMEGTRRGAYTVEGARIAKPAVIIVSTGTEVSICVDAAKLLTNQGVATRVVSMPCQRLFDNQSEDYKRTVFVPEVPVLSVEPYSSLGWERYSHFHIGLKLWGASGPAPKLYEEFGFTPTNIAAKAQALIKYFSDHKLMPAMRISNL